MERSAAMLGVLLAITYVALVQSCLNPAGEALMEGFPRSNIQCSRDSMTYFRVLVPPSSSRLKVTLRGGVGNVDLYILNRRKPSLNSYDRRSASAGSDETIIIERPQAGVYYLLLHGVEDYQGVAVLAENSLARILINRKTVAGLSGESRSATYLTFSVPTGVNTLTFKTFGGKGDVDLYLRRGSFPTRITYLKRSKERYSNDESIKMFKPKPGPYYLMIYGRRSYTGVSVVAYYKSENDTNETIDKKKKAVKSWNEIFR